MCQQARGCSRFSTGTVSMTGFDLLRRIAIRTMPRGLLTRVEPMVSSLPDRVGARLNPQKYVDMPDGPDQPLTMGEGSVRLVVGCTNTAGQAYQWARTIDALDDHRALSIGFVDPRGFGFPVHRAVPARRAAASADWHRAEFAAITRVATHVLIESARPLFGPLFGRDIERQVRALHRRGVRVGIVAHGSDVRDVRAHQRREPHSPYSHPDLVPNAESLDAAARRTRATLARMGVPLFASTPNVLLDLPSATWLPIVVNTEPWEATTPVLHRSVPIVVHAPSNAGLKGTEVVDAVLSQLDAAGLIEYQRLVRVPHADVIDAYRNADIVVDSLRMGGYGVAACEAMATGRLVLSHVNANTRDRAQNHYGLALPVWESTVDTLGSSLRSALADREAARALAAQGPGFVRHVHDGRASAKALAAFLSS